MSTRLLVAGVGNIFQTDDGFATEVVRWLDAHARRAWPGWVRLSDFGIRGVHLAYELLDGVDELILVDAMHRQGGRPGDLYVIEPRVEAGQPSPAMTVNAHDLSPESVLRLVGSLGGRLGRVTVVGCEPASTQDGLGLTEIVADRVPEAGQLVDHLVSAAVRAHFDGLTRKGMAGSARGHDG